MIVRDLIWALENFDPEAEVVIIDIDGNYYTPSEVWRAGTGEAVVE